MPPGTLFQWPQAPESGKPHFKLQIPGNGLLPFRNPEPTLLTQPGKQPPADPGMVRRPHGFAQQTPHPAQPRNLYPDLKVLPIEIATLDLPGSPVGVPELQPIPRTWTNAKVEPIPTTWSGYRMVPVTLPAGGNQPKH